MVVLVGKFNPQIFQPSWFARHNLIPGPEADAAQLTVVHPEISDFSLDWCHLNVSPERLTLDSQRPERYPPLFDLLISTFNLLSHTPITQVGLNKVYEFKFSNMKEWHAYGHKLAPKEPWAKALTDPGMAALQMRGSRTDDKKGFITVDIRTTATQQMRINVNDHFELGESETISELLEKNSKRTIEQSDRIVKELLPS